MFFMFSKIVLKNSLKKTFKPLISISLSTCVGILWAAMYKQNLKWYSQGLTVKVILSYLLGIEEINSRKMIWGHEVNGRINL